MTLKWDINHKVLADWWTLILQVSHLTPNAYTDAQVQMITSRKADRDVNNAILLVWVIDVINDFHSTTFFLFTNVLRICVVHFLPIGNPRHTLRICVVRIRALIHPDLRDVTPSLIPLNPSEQMCSVQISLLVTFPSYISWVFTLKYSTKEFKPHARTHHVVIIVIIAVLTLCDSPNLTDYTKSLLSWIFNIMHPC